MKVQVAGKGGGRGRRIRMERLMIERGNRRSTHGDKRKEESKAEMYQKMR